MSSIPGNIFLQNKSLQIYTYHSLTQAVHTETCIHKPANLHCLSSQTALRHLSARKVIPNCNGALPDCTAVASRGISTSVIISKQIWQLLATKPSALQKPLRSPPPRTRLDHLQWLAILIGLLPPITSFSANKNCTANVLITVCSMKLFAHVN